MQAWPALAAFIATLLSAMALYANSAHCPWRVMRAFRGKGGWVGLALAGLSLWLWVRVLGGGAGLCAMLGTWMLALMLLPWLTAWWRAPGDGAREPR